MTTKEAIKIMQAFVDGKIIESYNKFKYDSDWFELNNPSWDWNNFNYRIKPEPEYIPYDFSDAEDLIGNIVRHKDTKSLSVITNVNPKNVTSSGTVIKYEDLFNRYKYTDGSICGKLKQ